MFLTLALIANVAVSSTPVYNVNSCEICIKVASYATEIIRLNKNETETKIEFTLDSLCSKLPHSIANDCMDDVSTYVPEVIESLVTTDVKTLCSNMKFCY